MRGHPGDWKDPWKLTDRAIKNYLKKLHKPIHKGDKNWKRAQDALKKEHEAHVHPPGKDVSVQESAADHQYIFGKVRVGGVFSYVSTADDNSVSPHAKDAYLLLAITIAAHRINQVTAIYLDDEAVTYSGTLNANGATATGTGKWANKFFAQVNLGTYNQSALSQLVTDSGGDWASSCKQLNCATVYLRLRYDENVYPNGLPQINFDVEGYSNSSFTRNPFTILESFYYDNIIGGHGVITFSSIFSGDNTTNAANYNEAKDICNQLVSLAAGGTETRYLCDMTCKSSESVANIMDKMLASFGGQVISYSNLWWGDVILAPALRTPVFTLSDDDLLSEIVINTTKTLADYYTKLGGTHVNPNKNWEETDFPPVTFSAPGSLNTPYEGEEEISLPATLSPTTCMRLAKIQLLREKYDLTITFTARLNLFKYSCGDNFYYPNATFGWDTLNSSQGKIFEIQETTLKWVTDSNGDRYLGYEIVAKENDSSIYAWSSSEETGVIAMPSLNFPKPGANANTDPTSLAITSGVATQLTQPDGSKIQRVLMTWTQPSDGYVNISGYIQIQFKKHVDSNWENAPNVPGSEGQTYLYGLQAGISYDFQIRGVRSDGGVGNWVGITQTVGAGTAGMAIGTLGLTYSG